MNEEIKQALDYFNGWCEEGTNITITSDFIENVGLLNDYIANLQEENQKLKDEIEEISTSHFLLFKKYDKIEKENQKLVKVIEELKKWLNEKEHYYSTIDCQKEVKYEFLRISNEYTKVLNKLTELKGDSND